MRHFYIDPFPLFPVIFRLPFPVRFTISLCECFLFEELQPSLTIAHGGGGWPG